MLARRIFPALLLTLFALPASAKPTPEEWKKLKFDAEKAFSGSDGDERVKAVNAVGAADCLDGVKLLVLLLNMPDAALLSAEKARDAFEPEYKDALERIQKFARQGKGLVAQSEADLFEKKQREWDELNSKVQDLSLVSYAIGEAMGKTKDAEAVKWLVDEALKDKQWRTRATVALALGSAPADNAAATPALQAAMADKDARVRAAAVEALGKRGAKELATALLDVLAKDESWQVKVAAAEALGRLEVRETVGPLIARMQEEQGRLREDIDAALKKITGISYRGDALGWKGWWEVNKAKWESGELVKKEEEKKDDAAAGGKDDGKKDGNGDVKGGTVTFYGIETKSKNLVFIVDVSGSMAEPAHYVPDTSSGGGQAGPGPKGKRKIDVARWELAKALSNLADGTKFNIITFANDVKVYSPLKMLVMNKQVKAQVVAYAEKLEPTDGTNIYDAFEKAFLLAGEGAKNADANFKDGIDTILFMTDGKPTVGKTIDAKQIGDTIQKWNAVRKIRIHCIGVGDHDPDLLKRLADESGGTYVKR